MIGSGKEISRNFMKKNIIFLLGGGIECLSNISDTTQNKPIKSITIFSFICCEKKNDLKNT